MAAAYESELRSDAEQPMSDYRVVQFRRDRAKRSAGRVSSSPVEYDDGAGRPARLFFDAGPADILLLFPAEGCKRQDRFFRSF